MNCVLIGYGEVGRGIFEVFSVYHVIAVNDPEKEMNGELKDYDIMLITIPYSDKFIDIVKDYQKRYKPKTTIIFSTVPIGTTAQIPNAVHVPIEGKHPYMAESLKLWHWQIGGWDNTAYKFFREANQIPSILEKPEFTELLKLQSTSNYGLMIEFARYIKEICDKLNMPYDEVLKYNFMYNNLYEKLGITRYRRYLLDAPEGNIGGHCVVPNAKLLDEQFPSVFLKEIYKDKEDNDA